MQHVQRSRLKEEHIDILNKSTETLQRQHTFTTNSLNNLDKIIQIKQYSDKMSSPLLYKS